jgi:hypothetical protein
MAKIIFTSRTLQKFGGFDYRIVYKGNSSFAYEVQGPSDAMGVVSWVAPGDVQLRQIKEDLLQEYLGELQSRKVEATRRT